jgi:ElaA protein
MSNLRLETKPFTALSTPQLYEILALRQSVFVVEQNCPFLDADGKDQTALHCLATDPNQNLMAYTRLFDVDDYYPGFASIGRVVSSPLARGKKYGQMIFQYSIDKIQELYGKVPIKIGAQSYLEAFYKSFGFEGIGENYVEDGIAHQIMVRKALS